MSGKRKVRAEQRSQSKTKASPKSPANVQKETQQQPTACITKKCVVKNVTQYINNTQIGRGNVQSLRKASHGTITNFITMFHVCKNESPFDRRVTFLAWHPKNSNLLCVGSKGGDIVLWNCDKQLQLSDMIKGKGPGDTIFNIKCNPQEENQICTSSLDGTVGIWDYECKTYTKLKDVDSRCALLRNGIRHQGNVMDTSGWCTGLDVVDFNKGPFIIGDNDGYLNSVGIDGKVKWTVRAHKTKISHVEYFKKDSRYLVTSSIDHTVKVWDTRFITTSKDKRKQSDSLATLHHDYAVNSAYFSATDSGRLLTTDQHSELRVYRAPLWNLETVISHPHRQFQHLTAIKATWHPHEDIIVVGRYPDVKSLNYTTGDYRSIDFFAAETGKYLYKLMNPGVNGIVSLNKFNNTGGTLASGMGFNILVWKPCWNVKFNPLAGSKIKKPIAYKHVTKL